MIEEYTITTRKVLKLVIQVGGPAASSSSNSLVYAAGCTLLTTDPHCQLASSCHVQAELVIHLLLLIDRLPLYNIGLGIAAHLAYLKLLPRFPFIQVAAPATIVSVGVCACIRNEGLACALLSCHCFCFAWFEHARIYTRCPLHLPLLKFSAWGASLHGAGTFGSRTTRLNTSVLS
jgi:hypothetical protein